MFLIWILDLVPLFCFWFQQNSEFSEYNSIFHRMPFFESARLRTSFLSTFICWKLKLGKPGALSPVSDSTSKLNEMVYCRFAPDSNKIFQILNILVIWNDSFNSCYIIKMIMSRGFKSHPQTSKGHYLYWLSSSVVCHWRHTGLLIYEITSIISLLSS